MPATPLTSQPTDQRAARAGSVRAFAGAPTSVDEATRSFDIVITTEHPVRRFLPDPRRPHPTPDGNDCSYIEVDEVLVAAGVDLSRAPRMPLIDCHDTYSGISKILGKIDDVRVEGTAVVGRASLARKNAELLPDIVDGYFGQISAGYDYDLRRDAELIEREGDVPLLLVKRWLLTEGSLVPVGADPNSFIRSLGSVPMPIVRNADSNKPQEKKMDIETLVKAAEDAVASAEEAIGAAEDAIPEELVERIRALRSVRVEEDTTATAEDESPTDGERADGEEQTDEEKQEVEAIRSIAKGYGCEKVVTDMRALGARASDIRSAVAKTIAERGAPTVDATVTVKPVARSEVASFDPKAVYAARSNKQR